jgi:hypothetical protein
MSFATRRHLVVGLVIVLGLCAWTYGIGPLRLEVAGPPIPPLSETSVKLQEWMTHAMVGNYDRIGKRDPKWDEAARETLRLSVNLWGTPRPRGDGNLEQFLVAKRAIGAGCDDPLVLYAYARTLKTFGKDQDEILHVHQRAADALFASKYSAFHRALSQLRVAQIQLDHYRAKEQATGAKGDADEWMECSERINKATDLLADLAAEPGVPVAKWIELGDALEGTFRAGIGFDQMVEKALPHFEKPAPKVAYLTIKGRFYTTWAWQARGQGFASTVTPEGARLMHERLEVAQAALEEAWKLDPSIPSAAARMITVELGQGLGRDRMELWFKRATTADPDNDEAYTNKLYYLEPKWYGSAEEMLTFGRQCLRQGRFLTNAPAIIENAHVQLSHYTHGGWSREADVAYYKNPAVWADLKAAQEGYLRADQGLSNNYKRNLYARSACLCEAWDDAAKMFALFDQPDIRVWKPEAYQAARKEALQRAGRAR